LTNAAGRWKNKGVHQYPDVTLYYFLFAIVRTNQ